MIPTIEDILRRLASGEYTLEVAQRYIDAHVELAERRASVADRGVQAVQGEPVACERCGEVPETHTANHWCANQSFAASVASPAAPASPSVAQAEWISVDNRLPDVSGIEDGETVLVANRGGSFAAEWHGTGITGFSSIHGDQFVQVTHWQPMPSPPSQASATGEV